MKYVISLYLAALLVACGGGGGGTADSGNTITPTTATQIQFGNGTFGSAKFSE